jgi:hypothetical protein
LSLGTLKASGKIALCFYIKNREGRRVGLRIFEQEKRLDRKVYDEEILGKKKFGKKIEKYGKLNFRIGVWD